MTESIENRSHDDTPWQVQGCQGTWQTAHSRRYAVDGPTHSYPPPIPLQIVLIIFISRHFLELLNRCEVRLVPSLPSLLIACI